MNGRGSGDPYAQRFATAKRQLFQLLGKAKNMNSSVLIIAGQGMKFFANDEALFETVQSSFAAGLTYTILALDEETGDAIFDFGPELLDGVEHSEEEIEAHRDAWNEEDDRRDREQEQEYYDDYGRER